MPPSRTLAGHGPSRVKDPGAIRVTERWTTREALSAHFATPHMAAMQAHPPRGVNAHFYKAKEIEMPQ